MKTSDSTPQTASERAQQSSTEASPAQDASCAPAPQPAHPMMRHIAGHPLSARDKLIPELAGKYTLLSVLGRGAQGTVYLAESNESAQRVAIKQLPIDSVSAWKTYDLFHREVDTLSKLDMPGIARFYEAAEHLSGDHPGACIVQQYIEGRTLAEMMKCGHRFSLSRIFDIALKLITLLEKLHHHNPPVIHRDIKPSNLILTPSDKGFDITLIDFGAVANPQIQSGGSTVAGTYGFMPPEQITGTPRPESDIYALGVMLVTMITGISPEDIQVKDFRLIIDPILENVPPQVVPVLRQMTEPLVSARLSDYEKLKEIFSAFAQDKYDIPSLLHVSLMPSDEFEDRLSKVKSLGQPDNILLWQQLSETVPRNVPQNYLHLQRDLPEARKPQIKYLVILLLLLSLLIMLTIGILYYFFSAIAFHVVTICIITGIYTIIAIKLIDFFKKRKRFSSYNDLYIKDNLNLSEHYNALLKNGRRSIATVVSVKQKSLKTEHVFNNFNYSYNSFVIVSPPAFEIKYKFNPPDDNNPNDLIRSYISSRPTTLHPGDPLPILYLIQENNAQSLSPNTPKTVLSMPFPFPFKDYARLDRIVSLKE